MILVCGASGIMDERDFWLFLPGVFIFLLVVFSIQTCQFKKSESEPDLLSINRFFPIYMTIIIYKYYIELIYVLMPKFVYVNK